VFYTANGAAEIVIIPPGTKSISVVKRRFELEWFEGIFISLYHPHIFFV
jgi:hypothetical protein